MSTTNAPHHPACAQTSLQSALQQARMNLLGGHGLQALDDLNQLALPLLWELQAQQRSGTEMKPTSDDELRSLKDLCALSNDLAQLPTSRPQAHVWPVLIAWAELSRGEQARLCEPTPIDELCHGVGFSAWSGMMALVHPAEELTQALIWRWPQRYDDLISSHAQHWRPELQPGLAHWFAGALRTWTPQREGDLQRLRHQELIPEALGQELQDKVHAAQEARSTP